MDRLIQSLCESSSTDENYEIYGDITFSHITTEKRKTTYTNKLLIFLNWPHLKEALQECDAVILAEHLSIEEDSITATAEVEIELNTDLVPVKDLKSFESSTIISQEESTTIKDHLCQLCGMRFPIQKSLKIEEAHIKRTQQ